MRAQGPQGLRRGRRRGQAHRRRPQGVRRRRHHARLLRRARDAGQVRRVPDRPPGLRRLRARLRGRRGHAGRPRSRAPARAREAASAKVRIVAPGLPGRRHGARRLQGLPRRRASSRYTAEDLEENREPARAPSSRTRCCGRSFGEGEARRRSVAWDPQVQEGARARPARPSCCCATRRRSWPSARARSSSTAPPRSCAPSSELAEARARRARPRDAGHGRERGPAWYDGGLRCPPTSSSGASASTT